VLPEVCRVRDWRFGCDPILNKPTMLTEAERVTIE
jgi:hypothetical protein